MPRITKTWTSNALAALLVLLAGCAHQTAPANHAAAAPTQQSMPLTIHPNAIPRARTPLPEHAPPNDGTVADGSIPAQWQMPQGGRDVHVMARPSRSPRTTHHHAHTDDRHHADAEVAAIIADVTLLTILAATLHHAH